MIGHVTISICVKLSRFLDGHFLLVRATQCFLDLCTEIKSCEYVSGNGDTGMRWDRNNVMI